MKSINIRTQRNYKKQIKNRYTLKKIRETRLGAEMNLLKSECPNTNECLMLGKKTKEISRIFGNFGLQNAFPYLRIISTETHNSNVYEVKFHTEDIKKEYYSYGILKTVKGENYDNLQYEYIVGQYLNTLNKNLPCFIETYHLYKKKPNIDINNYVSKHEKQTTTQIRKIVLNRKYHNKGTHINTTSEKTKGIRLGGSITQSNNNQPIQKLSDIFTLIHGGLNLKCDGPTDYALVIQNIYNSKTFKSESENEYKKSSMEYFHCDIPAIVFQIYFSLVSMFKNKMDFVHQDLHLENILLYQLNDKRIEYEYIIEGNKIRTRSNYLIKMIDYSRSYFTETPLLYKKAKTTCRKKHGFFLYKKPIDYYKPNVSIDLRLLNQLKNFASSNKNNLFEPNFHTILKDVVFDGNGITRNIPEIVENPIKINNIFEAFDRLLQYITSDIYKEIQELYSSSNKKYLKITLYDDFKFPMEIQ